MNPPPVLASPSRYVPGWTVTPDGTATVSLCTACGWTHRDKDQNLACVARVDHEIMHRRTWPPAT